MNYKTTIFLLVLLIVVGGYFFFIDTGEMDELPLDGDAAKPTLLSADTFDANKVDKVTIQRGDQTIELVKDGTDWKQTQPVQYPVNNWSAERFAEDAAKLAYNPSASSRKDLPSKTDAGLEPPQAVLTLSGGGKPTVIKLGRTLSIGGRGYAMLGDSEKIYIVDDTLHKLVIDGKPGEWRKKSMTGPKESEADHVTLTHDGTTIELAKTDGRWAFAAPNTGRASTSAVSDLLNALGRLYINDFVADQPDNLALYGLKNPAVSLTITKPAVNEGDEKPVTSIAVGSATDLESKYYHATTDGGKVIFKIGADDVKKFRKSVDDLREKRLTPLASADVTHITVTRAGQSPVNYQRTPEGWTYGEGGPTYAADNTRVADMLSAVTGAEASSFVTDFKGEGDADLTVTLAASARPEPETLRFFITDKSNYTALRGSESIGYVISMDKVSTALEAGDALAMRSRTVDTVKRDELTKVTLTRGKDVLTFTREDKDAAWQLTGAEKFETAALTALINAVTPVKNEGWSAADGAVAKGDALSLTAGDKSVTITWNADGHASVSDVPGTFVTTKALRDAAGAEFAWRTVMDFDTARIKQVTVGDLTITKDGTEYKVVEGDAKIDASKAGQLYDTLAGLRAERFGVTVGEAAHTITVTLDDDTTQTLTLDAEGNARLGDKTFSLPKSDVEALTAKLSGDGAGDKE